MSTLAATLDALTEQFNALHTRKEDLFWAVKMGLAEDAVAAQRALSEAEVETNRFLQDPKRLAVLRGFEQTREGSADAQRVLHGWIRLFAANVIESPEGRALSEELVRMEGELQTRRAAMKLGYTDPDTGAFVAAGTNKLALLMRNDDNPARRRAAYEGLRAIEPYVIEHGFLEIVKTRNKLGRLLGYEDYYAWRVAVVEGMTKAHLFGLLDELARRTAARARHEMQRFAEAHGEGALDPWTFLYKRAGKLAAALDPYFGFAPALRRWGRSFAAMNVKYRGARLTLDLVDRKGKYENGFMHGPEIAYSDKGRWRPARINFTANAVPGAVGSGLRATETLFHEGGHAAHFSNIVSDAPCFAQEFAPTSVAYAETQSMFMDSLLEDADWRRRYLHDAQGEKMPVALIEESVREAQPMKAWDVRAMLTIPLAERRLYELADDRLDAETVLGTFREVERELQGLSAGVRPVLAVPHLLTAEASAYYHGYIMAEMAVHQTRAHFIKEDGHLVDNPRIGPALAEHYWRPGNAVSFDDTLRGLTGKGLSTDAIVAWCDRSVDEAVAEARAQLARLDSIAEFTGPVSLDATVRVIHGRTEVASTEGRSFEDACAQFESWIAALPT
ncbi:MAG: hypothetical protein JNK72_22060 [Myxococcales bacterium]|nr:hypothetical protein [Myxococcales bacterium]